MIKKIYLFETIRRKGYWFIDFCRGSAVRSHYDGIRQIIEAPKNSKAEEIRNLNLYRLLAHATKTTPFYKKFKNHENLQDFPIIDKNVILDDYESFKSSSFKNSKLYRASSSGSTGIPFSILQDRKKRNRNTADVIYFSEVVGNNVGNKLYYIKLWDHTNSKSKWVTFFQNIFPHNVMDSSPEDIQNLISTLEKDVSTKVLLGYPSFFEEVCNYLDNQEVLPKIRNVSSIISMAEGIKDMEKKRISKYFGADVFERYSNQENGILAQQTKENNEKYVLNWASYFFEFLELDSDKHVKSGELGRIVVTDLFNFSMPMIRYDTGDMAIYEETKKDEYPVLTKIYGRHMDAIYNTSDEIVSPFIFYMVLDYSKVKQFQFVQTGRKEYVFKLNGKPQDVKEDEIIKYFKTYLGEDAVIMFDYVDEIPLVSSGKRKKIVNSYIRNP